MVETRGSTWGPAALPDLLIIQLGANGVAPADASTCVRMINAAPDAAAAASWFVDLGSCKLLEGDIDGALAAWRHAVSSTDARAAGRALLNLGLLYEHLQLHRRALAALTSASQRGVEPYATQASLARARCQRALGETVEAMETMAGIAESLMGQSDGPGFSETMLGLGDVAAEAGRLDSAERAWRVAAGGTGAAAPRAAERLVELVTERGHDDELVTLIESLPDHGAATASVLHRAEVLARLGRKRSALALTGALSSQQLRAPDRFRLAEIRLQLGLVNEAIDEYEALLGDDQLPVRQRAGFALGEIYHSYEMSSAAVAMLDRVVRGADPYWSPKAERLLRQVLDNADPVLQNEPAVLAGAGAGARVNGHHEAVIEISSVEGSPVVVLLSEVDTTLPQDDVVDLIGAEGPPVDTSRARIERSRRKVAKALPGHGDTTLNPYARLAPDADEDDVAPSTRNPYAELAPNYPSMTFEVGDDVEVGDWESLLGDWTSESAPEAVWEPPSKPAKKRSSAFSRYA